MRRKYRRTMVTAAESAELWGRWKKGEGLEAIARALGRSHSSIFYHMRTRWRVVGGGSRF